METQSTANALGHCSDGLILVLGSPVFSGRHTTHTAVLGRQPTVMGRQPTVMGRQPTVIGRQPTVTGRQPAVMGMQPTVMGRHPTHTHLLWVGRPHTHL